MKTLLTTAELASRWGMAVGSVENWRQQKKGPPYIKLGGSRNSDVRYPLKEVEKYEKANMVKTDEK